MYEIGQTIYYQSLGSPKTYSGTIISKNEHAYTVKSGPYTKIVLEDEIKGLKQ